MNTQVPEQLVTAQKASFEALYGLANTAFEGFEKLVELNVQATKASIAENQAVASEAVSAKESQSLFELQSRRSQATTQEAQAYWRHVNEIVTETRSQLVASSEKLVSEYVRQTQAVIDSLAKNSPAGGETLAAFWSKGFGMMRDAGNASYEQVKAAAQEAAEVVDKEGKPVVKAKH
jgi:phasin family protein